MTLIAASPKPFLLQKHAPIAGILIFLVAALRLGFAAAPAAEEPGAKPPPSKSLPIAELKHEAPVDFEKEILPFLKNNCLACHNTTKAKGNLNLETPQLILKGGDTGPALVPSNSAASLIFKAATHVDPELIMPPKDNKANASELNPEQLALLKLWIDQGAKGEVHLSSAVHWLDQPPNLDPIFAVAVTPDGQFAACSRGNQIALYHLPSRQTVSHLLDPALSVSNSTPTSAHRDLVNSLVFNPQGTLLASAAYREVKLWRRAPLTNQSFLTFEQPAGLIVLSPDHNWLATAWPEQRIALFDLRTRQRSTFFSGHSNVITALAFSPDNQQLCSAGADKTLQLHSVRGTNSMAVVETASPVQAIVWLADSNQIAAAGENGAIQIWNVTNNQLTASREWKAHEGKITGLSEHPQTAQLLSGGLDGFIRFWDLKEGKMKKEVKQDGPILAMTVATNRFASAGTNRSITLWNLEDFRAVATLKGDRYAQELVSQTDRELTVARADVEFYRKSLEGAETESKKQKDRVATATATNTFTEKVFLEKEKALKEAEQAKTKADKDLQDLLATIKKVTEEYEQADKQAKEAAQKAKVAADKAVQAQLSAERALLSKAEAEKIASDTAAVAAKTKAIDTTDPAKEVARRIAEESAAVAAKSRTFAEAVAADADSKTKLSKETKATAEQAIEQVAALSFAAGQLKPTYDKTLAEAPEKRKQATNTIESAAKTLDAADKEFKRAETRRSVTTHELELAMRGAERASNKVNEAQTTLQGAQTNQNKITTQLEQAKKAAAAAEQIAMALDFSPDGKILAGVYQDGRVHTWTAETGQPIEVLSSTAAASTASSEASASGAKGVVFLDAHRLLSRSQAKQLELWSLNPIWTLERVIGSGDANSPLQDRVNAVRFSPDGLTLATGGGEPTRSGEIKLWSIADGSLRRDYTNVHSDAVLSLDFSPDNRYLASSSADRFVRVLELASGKIVRAFEGHTSYVLGVAWKSDSRTLATAGADNVIKIWDFTTGDRKKNIDGATKEVTSISFVGITDQAVATSGDNQVRLLKDNGDKVRSFEGATDFMHAAAATPDGNTIVAGGQDGVLRIWNGTDGKIVTNFATSH